ncbi:putative ATP-dependent RNA helicase DDX47 [Theileria parva strain Muguga]|uniref:putative ATP-dependent RNA helicase DDX47 n=1 Tax=Theileria parva strain Muguga TaxID=333668 RepID=UPI001C61B4F8|nr:putative ATP-dependent RNA helicase DDX47 [Theileria parva strain Muguga]EAN33012.2 putative ATP-dependent RNA helicase DDX47 [Theileria parva strain Muguga]
MSSDSDPELELEKYKSRLMSSINRKMAVTVEEDDDKDDDTPTFEDLGVCVELCRACKELGWKRPTKIQIEAIPIALSGKDIIGLAETGSGKTAAFTIPILQKLLEKPQRLFSLILAPTRELSLQIKEQLISLGSEIGLDVCLILGGLDMVSQALQLSKKPHIIVGSPGRIADHLQNTKGFSLETIKYLVLDEADKLLSTDFDDSLNKIITSLPKDKVTYLYSATMTSKITKLQKVTLMKPIQINVNTKYHTSEHLIQKYLLIPLKFKYTYLACILWKYSTSTIMVFCNTCLTSQKVTLFLQNLSFKSVCLHGKLSQIQRLNSLNSFKTGLFNILVVTDVGSRGLDIPFVDLVINFDVPNTSKDYIHRVGRTARAGKSGISLTLITQYDIESFQRTEYALNKKLEEYKDISEEEVYNKYDECCNSLRNAEMDYKNKFQLIKTNKKNKQYNKSKFKLLR